MWEEKEEEERERREEEREEIVRGRDIDMIYICICYMRVIYFYLIVLFGIKYIDNISLIVWIIMYVKKKIIMICNNLMM